jgi:hypothetical protein
LGYDREDREEQGRERKRRQREKRDRLKECGRTVLVRGEEKQKNLPSLSLLPSPFVFFLSLSYVTRPEAKRKQSGAH